MEKVDRSVAIAMLCAIQGRNAYRSYRNKLKERKRSVRSS